MFIRQNSGECEVTKDTMEEYPFGEEVPAGIYEGFSIKV